jgi:N-acetylglucosamine malate deacetylase 1
MNVLVIAPHPDDETIGCGGALCSHAARGDRVSVVFLTSGELGLKQLPAARARSIRQAEARRAARILGLADLIFLGCRDWLLGEDIHGAAGRLRPILKEKKPELIYLPHRQEAHPDHQAAVVILTAALGRSSRRPAMRGYEVWTPLSEYDHVEDISRFMNLKLAALRAYRSQLTEFNYVRAVTGLNQYRGALAARTRFAEVFSRIETGGG